MTPTATIIQTTPHAPKAAYSPDVTTKQNVETMNACMAVESST